MSDCPWAGGETVGLDFCETLTPCAWVKQPAATTASLAFVVPAVVAITLARRHRQPALYALAVAAVATMIGTAALHASGLEVARVADHAGMQAVNSVMVAIAARRWSGARWGPIAAGVLVWWGLMVAGAVLSETLGRWLYVLGWLPATGVEVALAVVHRAPTDYRWLGITWLLYVAAGGVWLLQSEGVWCPGDGWAQPHALWHVLAALALAAVAVFYVQFERLRPGHAAAARR